MDFYSKAQLTASKTSMKILERLNFNLCTDEVFPDRKAFSLSVHPNTLKGPNNFTAILFLNPLIESLYTDKDIRIPYDEPIAKKRIEIMLKNLDVYDIEVTLNKSNIKVKWGFEILKKPINHTVEEID